MFSTCVVARLLRWSRAWSCWQKTSVSGQRESLQNVESLRSVMFLTSHKPALCNASHTSSTLRSLRHKICWRFYLKHRHHGVFIFLPKYRIFTKNCNIVTVPQWPIQFYSNSYSSTFYPQAKAMLNLPVSFTPHRTSPTINFVLQQHALLCTMYSK